MEYRTNLHTHTNFCGGNFSVRELAASALLKGFDSLGFSEQLYIDFDKGNSLAREDEKSYIESVLSLKNEMKGYMDIYLGCEYDYFSAETDLSPYEYIIGSVGYVEKDGARICADEEEYSVVRFVKEHFGGNFYKYCKAYYENVIKMCEKCDFDIIAHFDLAAKYNEGDKYFDEDDSRYLIPAIEAMETLIKKGVIFEIGPHFAYDKVRTELTPNRNLITAIKNYGGSVIIGSGGDDISSLGYRFAEAMELAGECGFTSVKYFSDGEFLDFPI